MLTALKVIDKATGETVHPGNVVFTFQRHALTLINCTPRQIVCRDDDGTELKLFPNSCGLAIVEVLP